MRNSDWSSKGLGTSWMAWGPVDWVGGPPWTIIKKKIHFVFWIFFICATVTEISVKTGFGDQLNGLGTSWLGGDGPPRSKIRGKVDFVFWIVLIWATVTEISVEISFTLSSTPTFFGPLSRSGRENKIQGKLLPTSLKLEGGEWLDPC